MSLTLGSNISSLRAQRRLQEGGTQLASVFERLSSGQRINRASDDAAGLAISEDLKADARVFNQAIRNINDGQSVLAVAEGTVKELTSIVTRIRELATQSANGSLSNQQREALDVEAQELSDEFFRVSRSAKFNGIGLFDGSLATQLSLQLGYGTDGSIQSSLGGKLGDGTFSAGGTYGPSVGAFGDQQLGDLNGDGNLDIIALGGAANFLSVQLGNGDGSFQSPQSQALSGFGGALSLGDFNNDGVLDALVGYSTGSALEFRQGNGDGTFQDAVTSAGPNFIDEFATADVNNDGNLDILVGQNSSGSTGSSIMLGNGDGTFQSAATITSSTTFTRVALGDLNSDGFLDAITVEGIGGAGEVRLGNGDGSFQAAQVFSAGGNTADVITTDLDGDGNLDLLSSDTSNERIIASFGAGDGTFDTQQQIFTAGENPNGIAAGDFNGDGSQDFVVVGSDSNELEVYQNGGDRNFTRLEQVGFGTISGEVQIGDINNDGVLDVVARQASDAITFLGDSREGLQSLVPFSLGAQSDARQAFGILDTKLELLSEQAGVIGAFQSRLTSAGNAIEGTVENYAAANSRIRDADVATESSELTRLQILQQAAASVLSQANIQPELALTLLAQEQV